MSLQRRLMIVGVCLVRIPFQIATMLLFRSSVSSFSVLYTLTQYLAEQNDGWTMFVVYHGTADHKVSFINDLTNTLAILVKTMMGAFSTEIWY